MANAEIVGDTCLHQIRCQLKTRSPRTDSLERDAGGDAVVAHERVKEQIFDTVDLYRLRRIVHLDIHR